MKFSVLLPTRDRLELLRLAVETVRRQDYDDWEIIAGQAGVGLEIVEALPDAGQIVVPLGGGGLLAGIALAVKSQRPDIRVVGVQAEAVAPWRHFLADGGMAPVPADAHTIADGIKVKLPGHCTRQVIARHVDAKQLFLHRFSGPVGEQRIDECLPVLVQVTPGHQLLAGVASRARRETDLFGRRTEYRATVGQHAEHALLARGQRVVKRAHPPVDLHPHVRQRRAPAYVGDLAGSGVAPHRVGEQHGALRMALRKVVDQRGDLAQRLGKTGCERAQLLFAEAPMHGKFRQLYQEMLHG